MLKSILLNFSGQRFFVNPPESRKRYAPVAQGIERRFPKPCVGCSNHLGSAKKKSIGFMSIDFLFVFHVEMIRT